MALRQPRKALDDTDSSISSALSSPLSDFDKNPAQTSVKLSKSTKRSAPDAAEAGGAKKSRQSRAKKVITYKEDSDGGDIEKIGVADPEELVALVTPSSSKKRTKKDSVKKEVPTTTPSSVAISESQTVETASNGKAKIVRSRAVKVEAIQHGAEASLSESATPKKKAKPRKKAVKEKEETTTEAGGEPKVKRHRKTKDEKEAEAMPLATRTLSPKILLGAHVSGAGGVHNSVSNAHHIGANAFALFLKSQRKWENPALKPEHSEQFRNLCETHHYSSAEHIVPHGSYLVNLAQADTEKATQAYNSFLDDLERCETLGIRLYNFHPGNTGGEPRAEAIARLAGRLNDAHRSTSSVVTLLENMAAHPSGNTLGSTFSDLRDVIALVQDKSRVGVCLDTCHAFAAGYDLRSPVAFAATMADFDATVGMQYLRAVHVNDSKAPFASHRDLHANVGTGFLGLRAFHNLVNDQRFRGLPLVLETPIDKKDDKGKVVENKAIWAREIKMLESLVGMDPEGEEFLKMEAELATQGEPEREKHQEQFDRKMAESAKREAGGKRRKRGGKKGAEPSTSGDDTSGEENLA